MYKCFRVIFSFVFLTSVLSTLSQDKIKLSLERAVKLSIETSKTLNSSQAKIKAANARIDEVSSSGLPSLKIQGAYTRLSLIDEFKITLPDGKGGYSSVSFAPVLLNNTNVRLSLNQPLYTGNKISSTREAAELLAKASSLDMDKDKFDVTINTKSVYWNLQKSIKYKKLTDENINQIQTHLSELQNLKAQGLATENDILKMQVQLSEANLRQMDAQNMILLSTVNLNNILHLPLNTEIEPETEATSTNNRSSVLNELIEKAQKSRPEIGATDYRLQATKASLEATKGGYLPQIALTGNLLYANPNQRIFPNKDQFDATWDIGVSFSYDLWNWGTTNHQVTQVEAQITQTQDALSQVKEMISVEITQNYLNANLAKKKISVSEESTKQADENYRVTNEKFKNGMALNSDLIDAELLVLQAKINLLQAQIDFEIALAKLDKSVGDL